MFEVAKASGASGSAAADVAFKNSISGFTSQNIYRGHVSPGEEKCEMRSVSSREMG